MDVTSTDDIASPDELGDDPADARTAASGGPDRSPPELDLTPRTSAATASRGRRRWPAVVLVVAIVAGVGYVATRAVSDASLFFYTADEAAANRAALADRRFRIEGVVVPATTTRTGDGVTFEVMNNGTRVRVNHVGDPPELFQDGIPVVLEGRWASAGADAPFASDAMLVRHDNNYDTKNPDRLKQAIEEGTVPPGGGSTGAP